MARRPLGNLSPFPCASSFATRFGFGAGSSRVVSTSLRTYCACSAAELGVGLLPAGGRPARPSIPAWPWTEPLVWAGGTLIVLAGLLFGAAWLVDNGVRLAMLPASGPLPGDNPALGRARDALIAAVGGEELLAQARTVLNVARQDRFGLGYSVVNISGLSETYDSTYQVPTETATDLGRLRELCWSIGCFLVLWVAPAVGAPALAASDRALFRDSGRLGLFLGSCRGRVRQRAAGQGARS